MNLRSQEIQNEVYCMNDSRDFKDVQWIIPRSQCQPAFLSFDRDFEGKLRHNDKPPSIGDTQGTSGNVFVHPPASSSAL